MLPVETPFKTYTGLDGRPLDLGYVYFGQPNQNPETAPITVYWDAAGTQPAAQPLRTINGYIMRTTGSPANVFCGSEYSELVQDRNGGQIFYAPSSSEFSINSYAGSTLDSILKNSVGKVVQSIAALKAIDKTKYTEAFVTGYYAQGDGGSGEYWYDSTDTTSADNGGTIIVASDGGRWKLVVVGPVSAKQFGAKGDGTTNDSAALQAAHNTGKLIYYPEGNYLFSPGITIVSGGIVGDGPTQTTLKSNDTTAANLITFTGNFSGSSNIIPLFKDFSLTGNIAKATGAGIYVSPSTGEASYLHFENVVFSYIPTCIAFTAASLWKIIGCDFLAYSVAGVDVANTNDNDSGDSVIASCVFNNPYSTGSAVLQRSSGGLKIIGNKMLGGARGYDLQFNGVKNTADIIISGNSIENMTQQAISLARVSGAFTVINVAITGNQIGVNVNGIQTDNSGFLSEVAIGNNAFNIGGVSANSAIALSNVANFTTGINSYRGNGVAGSVAVSVAANCSNGKIPAGSNYSNYAASPISNLSTTTLVGNDVQSGSAATVAGGWAAYGALFRSATVTVTFPVPFLVAPSLSDIHVFGSTGAGEIGVLITSTSKTTFTFNVISAVTGIVATMNWKAWGIV